MTPTCDGPQALPILVPRPACRADHGAIADLMLACARHYRGMTPNDAAEAAEVADRILDGRSDVKMLIGWRGDDAVAFATYVVLHPAPVTSGALFLKDLFVRNGERGHGVGGAMIRAVARIAVACGCSRLDWTAEAGNTVALAFYERIKATRMTDKVYFRFADEDLQAFAATP